MALAIGAMAYHHARTLVWWLLGLTIAAWLFHLFIGSRAGLTRNTLGDVLPDGRARVRSLSDLVAIALLLPIVHLVLTFLLGASVIIILVGNLYGFGAAYESGRRAPTLSEMAPPPTPDNELPTKAQQRVHQIALRTFTRYSPNQTMWPTRLTRPDVQVPGAYLPGMTIAATGGPYAVTVVNRQDRSPVYVKLCSADRSGSCFGLRHFYLGPGASLALDELVAGRYELRYVDLESEIAYGGVVLTFSDSARGRPLIEIGQGGQNGFEKRPIKRF
ncbi:MAG: hypothetical protein R3E68_15360 [Burkholderiaceae bacterium]